MSVWDEYISWETVKMSYTDAEQGAIRTIHGCTVRELVDDLRQRISDLGFENYNLKREVEALSKASATGVCDA